MTPPCQLYTDCYTCLEMRCYWESNTCSVAPPAATKQQSGTSSTCSVPCSGAQCDTCSGAQCGTCSSVRSCTSCHDMTGCIWYKDTCTYISNVGLGVQRGVCPMLCTDIQECTRYTNHHTYNIKAKLFYISYIIMINDFGNFDILLT